jgi:hypothetical protein
MARLSVTGLLSALLLSASLVQVAHGVCATTLQACGSYKEACGSTTSFQLMINALQKTGKFNTFLYHLCQAELLAGTSRQIAALKQPVTIFAPTDSAFASSPRFTYDFKSIRCSNKVNPYGCVVPIVWYMMVPGPQVTYAQLAFSPIYKRWKTIYGAYLEKFPGAKGYYGGFFVGPDFNDPNGPSAKKITGAYLTNPSLFSGAGILVHGIGALLAPPDIWPYGFN